MIALAVVAILLALVVVLLLVDVLDLRDQLRGFSFDAEVDGHVKAQLAFWRDWSDDPRLRAVMERAGDEDKPMPSTAVQLLAEIDALPLLADHVRIAARVDFWHGWWNDDRLRVVMEREGWDLEMVPATVIELLAALDAPNPPSPDPVVLDLTVDTTAFSAALNQISESFASASVAAGTAPGDDSPTDETPAPPAGAASVAGLVGGDVPPALSPTDGDSDEVDLRATGLLWLINRQVFHPRGFALGRDQDDRWHLLGDGVEPWNFVDGEENDYLRAVEDLFALRREQAS